MIQVCKPLPPVVWMGGSGGSSGSGSSGSSSSRSSSSQLSQAPGGGLSNCEPGSYILYIYIYICDT